MNKRERLEIRRKQGFGGTGRGVESRAFTLIELLVVISVMLVLIIATLPALKAIEDSGRLSGANNAVSRMLATARALAIKTNSDVAVMFDFDVVHQVYSMQLIRQEALVSDADRPPYGLNTAMNAATVFVPVEGQRPMTLPQGAAVYGLGYGASRNGSLIYTPDDWYADLGTLPYFNSGPTPPDPWLFPRNDYRTMYGDKAPTKSELEMIDTFMVRFSPDGSVVTNAEELGSRARGGDSFLELDTQGSPKFNIWNPEVLPSIGGSSGPVIKAEVQLRAVTMLAIVDMSKMANDLNIREPWAVVGDKMPEYGKHKDANGNNRPDQEDINDWITQYVTPVSFNRYTGEIMRDIRR